MHILKGSIREQYFSQEGRKIQVEKKNRDILLIDHSSLMPTAGWYNVYRDYTTVLWNQRKNFTTTYNS